MHCTRVYKSFVELEKLSRRIVLRSINSRSFVYGDDVAIAQKNRSPIVALESTIITHGMPYPENLKVAIEVEDIVRKKGATPATIGLLEGRIHVGLTEDQLRILAKVDPAKTVKCSRRDIATIISKKLNGGTTVSATMLLANLAGIPVMATGGIGGVHRGAELTFDVSTDLLELGRTPVAVVCSGVKSILDIPKTLEYLETHGVPVIKIGETDHFPAFYCTETCGKIKAPYRVNNSKEAADIVRIQRDLGLETGILLAVAIPGEFALNPEEIEKAISAALERATSKSITGKAITPFLLEELNRLTSGHSLRANVALIKNNANVAAEIAVKLSQRTSEEYSFLDRSNCRFRAEKSPVVIGGAIMDTTLQVTDPEIATDGRTHAGQSRESCGGVARNVANALISLGLNGTRLISVVGNDQPGKAIIKSLGDGARTVARLPNTKTARCTVIIDHKGECRFVVGELEAFTAISSELINKYVSEVQNASILVLDGNLPPRTIYYAFELAADLKIPVWYEPTDINKATKVFESSAPWEETLHFISPNRNELSVIAKYFGIATPEKKLLADLKEVEKVAERLVEFIPVIFSTLGAQGVLVSRAAMKDQPFYDRTGNFISNSNIASRLYTPVSCTTDNSNETLNVSGCGDCLTAGILYGIHRNLSEVDCLSVALKAAALSLKSFDAVPDTLSLLRT